MGAVGAPIQDRHRHTHAPEDCEHFVIIGGDRYCSPWELSHHGESEAAAPIVKRNNGDASYYDARSSDGNPWKLDGLDKRDKIPEMEESKIRGRHRHIHVHLPGTGEHCYWDNGQEVRPHLDSEAEAPRMVKRGDHPTYYDQHPNLAPGHNPYERHCIIDGVDHCHDLDKRAEDQSAIQDGKNPPSYEHLPLLPPGVNPYIRGRKGLDPEPDLQAELVKREVDNHPPPGSDPCNCTIVMGDPNCRDLESQTDLKAEAAAPIEKRDNGAPSYYDHRPPPGKNPYIRGCVSHGGCHGLESEADLEADVALDEEAA